MPAPKNLLPCDVQCSVLTETRKLLQSDSRPLVEISQATGVPFYWLNKFSAGKVAAPSINRVQFLFEKLSGRKIKC